MGERRFFSASEAVAGRITIDGDEFHHIVHVMRHRAGDELEVVNGRGRLSSGRIAAVQGRSLQVDVQRSEDFPQPAPRVIIAVSLTKGHAMNWMIEKLSEMGVDEIRPLVCERTDVAWSQAQLRRWEKIAAQSLKVNRKYWLTRILPPVAPAGLIAAAQGTPARVLLDIAAARRLEPPAAWPALAVVGPPGDFSDAEKEMFVAGGFMPALVNDAILKTETAALAVAAILKND
ncbi:MAG: 16S rRNA (uracil(1498)-N(3))-methyltransferase [Acidobacteria bacterium]|jgi:16S rRNA (uracil1498-N3)-methyltransferase|nr:16S rRNA (uracil(1498)-N(3))-methyltransferase [Acidobacteriota bacterium]